MVLTIKEETILKADIRLRLAADKLHSKKNVVMQEISAATAPLISQIKAAHDAEVSTLRVEFDAANEDLIKELN